MQNALKFRLAGLFVALALVWAVPALAFADETDPKDLRNYTGWVKDAEVWIGEDDLTPSKIEIEDPYYDDEESEGQFTGTTHRLPTSAYTVDGTWYYEGKPTKALPETQPTESEQKYQIKLLPNKSKGYYGELLVDVVLLERHSAENFWIDQGNRDFLVSKGTTLEDISKQIKVFAKTKNGWLSQTYGKDYELSWGRCLDWENFESTLSDKKATAGSWGLAIKGIGKN